LVLPLLTVLAPALVVLEPPLLLLLHLVQLLLAQLLLRGRGQGQDSSRRLLLLLPMRVRQLVPRLCAGLREYCTCSGREARRGSQPAWLQRRLLLRLQLLLLMRQALLPLLPELQLLMLHL
jgi:hypothetical protein